MKKHSITKISLALLTFTLATKTVLPLNNITHSIYTEDPWRLVEQIFVVEPEEKCNGLLMQFARGGAVAGSLIPGLYLGKCALSNRADNQEDFDIDNREDAYKNEQFKASAKKYNIELDIKTKKDYTDKEYKVVRNHREVRQKIKASSRKWFHLNGFASLAATATLPIISYKIVKHFMTKHYNYKALENFINNWKGYKQHIPKRFHDMFDAIHTRYTKYEAAYKEHLEEKKGEKETVLSSGETYLKAIAPEVVSKMKQAVYNKYPEEYPTPPSSSLSTEVLKWSVASLATTLFILVAKELIETILPGNPPGGGGGRGLYAMVRD